MACIGPQRLTELPDSSPERGKIEVNRIRNVALYELANRRAVGPICVSQLFFSS
jgi:hypothetical protein